MFERNKTQNITSLLLLLFVLFIETTAYASAPDSGELLHEGNCQHCHQPEVYTRPDRMVNNLSQLKQRVKQCELMNDLMWFEEEVDAVTSYLNKNFYLF
jgi:mono/diheme cytochrome c family protein